MDDLLIGWETCRDLRILHPSYPLPSSGTGIKTVSFAPPAADIDKARAALMTEFKDVFDDSGPLKPMVGVEQVFIKIKITYVIISALIFQV